MKIEDHILTVGEHSEPLPRLPVTATVTVWRVPTDYMANGYFIDVRAAGTPATLPACADVDAQLVGVLDLPAHVDAMLAAAKQERLAAINQSCDEDLARIAASYPDGEVKSWPQQVSEAAALDLDPTAPTPLLTAIAQARGIDVVDLAELVRIKADAYAGMSGYMIGRRQFMESTLAAATTLDEINEVAW